MSNQKFINDACQFGNPWEYKQGQLIYLNRLLDANKDLTNTVFYELCKYIKLNKEDNTNIHIHGLHKYIEACREVE